MIAASFDPSGRTGEATLAHALAPAEASITTAGALGFAYVPPVHAAGPGPVGCLLEGELFNRAELCRALDVGAQTASPDLVALAFRSWDLAAFARLRGTFAIALWDADRRRAVLATDHFAVQPWYVRQGDGRVLAATSMRALLRMLPTAPAPDPIRAITWLSVSAPSGAETFARGIERLPGAHAVVIEDGVISTRRWWQPVYREPMRATRAALTQQVRASLGQAVRARISPTETAGLMVSGGFDSSAVAGVAASERAPTQLRTYSAGFPDDPGFDESPRVRALVAARDLPSYLLHVRPVGSVRLALEYQRDWGIPSGGPGYLLERPLLERAAQDGVGAILDGQGGDELFGVRSYLIADRVRRGQLRAALQLLGQFPDHVGRPPRRVLRHLLREYAIRPLLPAGFERALRTRGDATRHMPAWLRHDQLQLFLQSDARLAWKQAYDGPLWWRHLAHGLTRGRGGLAEYIGHRGRDLGLAMRPPLFDVELVELALRLPPELAFGGMNRSLARDSVIADVPDAVRLAAKKSNLRPFYCQTLGGPDLAPIRSLLEPSAARIYEYVDRAHMLELLHRPMSVGQPGWPDWTTAMWVATTAEIALRSLEDPAFCEDFIDSHAPPAPAQTPLC